MNPYISAPKNLLYFSLLISFVCICQNYMVQEKSRKVIETAKYGVNNKKYGNQVVLKV